MQWKQREMACLGCFLLEEPVRVADGETKMSQSKKGLEKTPQIFWLQERCRLWGSGAAGERKDGVGPFLELVKAGIPMAPSASPRLGAGPPGDEPQDGEI